MSEASMQNTHFCKNIQPKQTLIIIKINTTQKNHKNLQKNTGKLLYFMKTNSKRTTFMKNIMQKKLSVDVSLVSAIHTDTMR